MGPRGDNSMSDINHHSGRRNIIRNEQDRTNILNTSACPYVPGRTCKKKKKNCDVKAPCPVIGLVNKWP